MFLTAACTMPSVSMTTTAPDSGCTRASAFVTSSCTATTSENFPPRAAVLQASAGVVLRFVLLGGHQNWLKRVQHILLFHQKSTHTSAVFISFYRAWSWISHLSNFGSVGIQTGTWLEPGMANWACLSVCMPIPATVHAVLFLFWIICRQIKTDAKYH